MPNDAPIATIQTIRFDAASQPEPGKRMTSRTWYQRDGFRAGFWAAQPGRADIHYTKDELCTLLEGEVRLTEAFLPMKKRQGVRANDFKRSPNGRHLEPPWEGVRFWRIRAGSAIRSPRGYHHRVRNWSGCGVLWSPGAVWGRF